MARYVEKPITVSQEGFFGAVGNSLLLQEVPTLAVLRLVRLIGRAIIAQKSMGFLKRVTNNY